MPSLTLSSPAFKDHGEVPVDYTGDGRNISPPLAWSNVPAGTREFVLICEDPDAPQPGAFIHWLAYGISPLLTAMPAGISPQPSLEVPIRVDQGTNSEGQFGYSGPLPPVGHGIHRYIFRLYALDRALNLPPGIGVEELQRALRGHILDAAQITGHYKRNAIWDYSRAI